MIAGTVSFRNDVLLPLVKENEQNAGYIKQLIL